MSLSSPSSVPPDKDDLHDLGSFLFPNELSAATMPPELQPHIGRLIRSADTCVRNKNNSDFYRLYRELQERYGETFLMYLSVWLTSKSFYIEDEEWQIRLCTKDDFAAVVPNLAVRKIGTNALLFMSFIDILAGIYSEFKKNSN